MTSLPSALSAVLGDGIGSLDERGGVVARNPAMGVLLQLAGGPKGPAADLRTLGVDGDDDAALLAGETIALRAGDRHWQLRRVVAAGDVWLVAHETTSAEQARSAALELVRLRALAGAAGAIVHDFNNLLNATLGLVGHVRPHLQDPIDLQLLLELGHGTQQAAQLARTVARLLQRTDAERALVPATVIVDEAVALASKAAIQRGTKLVVDEAAQVPIVRTIVAEAVQALWHTLASVVERAPLHVTVALGCADETIGGGRARPCARVRLRTEGMPRPAAAELVRFANGAAGMLQASWRAPAAVALPLAAFVQRRLGGELRAQLDDDELQIDCLLPAVS